MDSSDVPDGLIAYGSTIGSRTQVSQVDKKTCIEQRRHDAAVMPVEDVLPTPVALPPQSNKQEHSASAESRSFVIHNGPVMRNGVRCQHMAQCC